MLNIEQLQIQPVSKSLDRLGRDWLFDKISSKGTSKFIKKHIQLIRAWDKEKVEHLRRFKWCLSTLHTDAELELLVNKLTNAYDIEDNIETGGSIVGESVEYHNANFCDTLLFGDLNLSYGEAMGVGSFDSRDDAENFADGLHDAGNDRYEVYGSGDDYWVVWDTDLSD